MITKEKGTIAEYSVALKALKKGWGVSVPLGDHAAYDLIFDVADRLVKIQVKSAWFDQQKQNFVVDNRRTKTNRRHIKRENYTENDFDFAVLYIQELDVCYIMPTEVFISYGSEIHLVEDAKRQRKPQSAKYREAWELIV
jgi:lipopolysaccharide export LptBFGC system permease protein LptF